MERARSVEPSPPSPVPHLCPVRGGVGVEDTCGVCMLMSCVHQRFTAFHHSVWFSFLPGRRVESDRSVAGKRIPQAEGIKDQKTSESTETVAVMANPLASSRRKGADFLRELRLKSALLKPHQFSLTKLSVSKQEGARAPTVTGLRDHLLLQGSPPPGSLP